METTTPKDILTLCFSSTPTWLTLTNYSIEEPNHSSSLIYSSNASPNLLAFGPRNVITPLVRTMTADWVNEMKGGEKEEKSQIEQDEEEEWLPPTFTSPLTSRWEWSASQFHILENTFRQELTTSLFEATKFGEDFLDDLMMKKLENFDFLSGTELLLEPSSIFHSGCSCFLLDFLQDELPKRPRILYSTNEFTTSSLIELADKAGMVIPLSSLVSKLGVQGYEFNEAGVSLNLAYHTISKSFRDFNSYNPPLPMCLYPETNIVLPFVESLTGLEAKVESKGEEGNSMIGMPLDSMYSVYYVYTGNADSLTKRLSKMNSSLNFFHGLETAEIQLDLPNCKRNITQFTAGLTLSPIRPFIPNLICENLNEELALDDRESYKERLTQKLEAFIFE